MRDQVPDLDPDPWMIICGEFISSEITRNILEKTPVIFGLINEVIMELMDERLSAFHTEIVALVGARFLTF